MPSGMYAVFDRGLGALAELPLHPQYIVDEVIEGRCAFAAMHEFAVC